MACADILYRLLWCSSDAWHQAPSRPVGLSGLEGLTQPSCCTLLLVQPALWSSWEPGKKNNLSVGLVSSSLAVQGLGADEGAALLLSVVTWFLEQPGNASAAACGVLLHPVVAMVLLWEMVALTVFADPEPVVWCKLGRPVVNPSLTHLLPLSRAAL